MHFLLNWLWQGCVVAFATVTVLQAVRVLSATARYYIWWAALFFVIALPAIPSISNSPGTVLAIRGSDRILPVVAVPDTSWATSSIAVILWCAWVAVHIAHIAVAVVALRRAEARSQPIPSAVETRLRHWGRIKERGRRTRLIIADGVRPAAVLGVVAPRIALAPALLEQLNEDDLDRVVAHEWAHVQRRDDLANLLQLLVRTIVGWHPAVWWIDCRLRLEREVACDDTAVMITGSPKRTPPSWCSSRAFCPGAPRRSLYLVLSPRRESGSESSGFWLREPRRPRAGRWRQQPPPPYRSRRSAGGSRASRWWGWPAPQSPRSQPRIAFQWGSCDPNRVERPTWRRGRWPDAE